jgi:hypothetical protein
MNPSTEDKVLRSLNKDIILSTSTNYGTRVLGVVYSCIKESNNIVRINCGSCLALGGYVYDSTNDSYLLNCIDYLEVGTIPVSFIASVKGAPHWKTNVPASDRVLKKYLTSKQKREIKKFLSSFGKGFYLSYIQMLDPNV